MKAILMALLMVVSFSIVGCGEEKPKVEKKGDQIKKVVTTPPAKAVDDILKKGKEEAKEKAEEPVDD
ncbi:MAG: hypothetical protein ABIF82_08275 [Planctomycetota bacterium]